MPAPQDHSLKSLASEMARLLNGSNGESTVRFMEIFGLVNQPEKSASGARPGFVGIWEASPQGYKRSEALREEWPFWADVPLIPPKGQRKRLLLLGESVARGVLYDRDFNPAMALEAALPMVLEQSIEVVDLAKSNLLGPQLMSLIDAAPALEPDVLVVFAGNNWLLPDKRHRYLEAAVLRDQGALGLKKLREQHLVAFVDTLRRQLTDLSARLPIVVVIPEFNLADWRLDAKADAPWLPLGRNRRWLECRIAARSALSSLRLDEAAALAREMVDLDGGTAASGWTLLADCARDTGDLVAARTYLEKARDAHLWDFTHQAPRAFSAAQQALHGCALPGRIAVVDLPSCLAAWQEGELPGGRLFLDYCHLTAEGIRVAMAATALEVANLLDPGRPVPSIESLANDIPPPSHQIEAAAHFAAALHSSYYGSQSGSFISYLCHEAARRSSEVAQAMRAYLELQTRIAPIWACSGLDRFLAATPPFLQRYVLRNQKLFGPVLLPAIADALEKNGLPSLAFLDELRKDEMSLSGRPRDLLSPYHRASLEDLDWLEWPRFQRAYSPTSRYPWVSRAPREVIFTLNCRWAGATGQGEGQVRINDVCVVRLPLTPQWSTHRFSAPAHLVRSGVNWLEIDWPFDLPDEEKEIRHIAREHEHGRVIPLLPAFAEISSLTAVQP